jgi:two-component system cell cycle response regulator DivK
MNKLSTKTILVVEDNPMSIELVKDLLEVSGYTVIHCDSAGEAIELLKRCARPDLILTDIQLPGIDGTEFVKILRSNDKMKDIPIIALTAYAMSGDQERFIEAGCNDYIAKPINTRDFVPKIESFLKIQKDT